MTACQRDRAHASTGQTDDLSWQDLARCAETDPEAYFPDKGGSTREAKRVCRSCEVRAECLEYAIETDQRFGVWGGLSERERRKLRRQQQEVAA
jgi:WhiB family transcriptional regulator, redox-sensing transcriptional regulator